MYIFFNIFFIVSKIFFDIPIFFGILAFMIIFAFAQQNTSKNPDPIENRRTVWERDLKLKCSNSYFLTGYD